MKPNFTILFCACLISVAAWSISGDANARRKSQDFIQPPMVDTPPPVRIAEPGMHIGDTATGVKPQQQKDVRNSNPTEVVNPE